MKAYAIVIEGNEVSEEGYSVLSESFWEVENEFSLEKFKAITPSNVNRAMIKDNIKWNYPWEGEVIDFASGLTKKSYPTKNHEARIACAMSHFSLWKKCVDTGEAIIILEHDSKFINKIDFLPEDTGYNIVGLNNPLMATRKAKLYHDLIKENLQPFQRVPFVDDDMKIPQGLAGNSAYMIKPEGASEMIGLVYKYGMWPNDAIMCRQLVSGLAVSKKFYTQVQGLRSTTTV